MGYKKTCFKCRKSFNRQIDFGSEQKYPCPDCGDPMTLMTYRFRPPKKEDLKSWEISEFLSKHGFIYQSIFETPSGGTYIKYPKTKRDAKDFVIRYREQSTTWKTIKNDIGKTEKLEPSEIRKLLKSYEQVQLDLSETGYKKEYFYKLVEELDNCSVQEVRPIQFISIESDIDSSEFGLQKEKLLKVIGKYNKQRESVFEVFIKHLDLKSKSTFGEIVEAMKIKNQYPKGKVGNWNFWQHGSDIEFENKKTDEHLNMYIGNKSALNPDSLYSFIHSQTDFQGLTKVLAGKLKYLIRMLDILVIEKRLVDIDNELRMKILTVNQSLQIIE